MALTYDNTGIAEYEALHTDENEWAVTQAIMFLSMPLGFGSITDRNEDEVYAAIAVYEAMCGPLLRIRHEDEWIERPITQADVHRRVGMKTNAVNGSTVLSNLKRIVADRFREEKRGYDPEGEDL